MHGLALTPRQLLRGRIHPLSQALHGGDQMGRRRESEGDGIADVQVPDARPLSLNASGLGHDVPDRIAEAVDACRDRDRGFRRACNCHT